MANYKLDDFSNFSRTLSRFLVGYNKGIVLSSITGSSMEIVNKNIELIKEAVDTIVTAFEEIRATSESTATNSTRIDTMMQEILQKNSEMGEGISQRVDEITLATDDAREISKLFAELMTKSSSIENITAEIQDVSDRTNILAINASIEAARAGEVGKGFRIIANEVRTLANQTGNFAKEIAATISEFETAVGAISNQMGTFLTLLDNFKTDLEWIKTNFSENSHSVNEAGGSLSEIAGAIREQNEALNDGLKSLERISVFLKDSHAVFTSLMATHRSLDSLLNREE